MSKKMATVPTYLPTYLQDAFDEMENLCVAKFEDSVSNEIVEDVSAEDLHKNNKERYNWLWNDVFEYQPAASYQLHFFKRLPGNACVTFAPIIVRFFGMRFSLRFCRHRRCSRATTYFQFIRASYDFSLCLLSTF